MRTYQKFLALVLFLSFTSLQAAEYTMAEVATHNSEKSCWIVISNEVFDVTNFIKKHPAPKTMLKACGQESTENFKTKKGINESHSAKAKNMKAEMKIGDLKI